MIKQIEIKNFQSHKMSILQFAPGVNIIIGSSDSGKSAIIKALRWATWNKPGGDSFRNWGGGDTEVVIHTDDNEIRRQKTNSKNVYILNNTEFKAFGTEPPEEIDKVLNLSELNLQRQGDRHFLITETPGATAHYLSKIANLEIIRIANKKANSKLSAINDSIRTKESSIESNTKEFKDTAYIEEAFHETDSLLQKQKQKEQKEKDVVELGRIYNNIVLYDSESHLLQKNVIDAEKDIIELSAKNSTLIDKQKAYQDLTNTLSKLGAIEVDLQELDDIIISDDSVNKLQDKITSYDEKIQLRDSLHTTTVKISQISEDIKECDITIQMEEKVIGIAGKQAEIKDKKKELDSLVDILENITNLEGRIRKGQAFINRKEKELEELMPDICPLCEQEITNQK